MPELRYQPEPTSPGKWHRRTDVARAAWLLEGQLQKMVLVVTSATSKEVLERWTFDVITDREAASGQCALRPLAARVAGSNVGCRGLGCIAGSDVPCALNL